MSVRAELQELVKWIADLQAKAEAKPKSKPDPLVPTRERWLKVEAALERASDNLDLAAESLKGSKSHSFLGELALDLSNEAEALSLRAHLLSRRAKSDPPPPKRRAGATTAKGTAKKSPADKPEERPPEDETPDPERPPSKSVGTAARNVGTAHNRLVGIDEAGDPPQEVDDVAAAFGDELDVLAEMLLSLQQQCERLEPRHKPKTGKG